MYRDKEKQKEANRFHAREYRRRKGMTHHTRDNVIPEGVTPVIPFEESSVIPITPVMKTLGDAEVVVKRISWGELKGRSALRGGVNGGGVS